MVRALGSDGMAADWAGVTMRTIYTSVGLVFTFATLLAVGVTAIAPSALAAWGVTALAILCQTMAIYCFLQDQPEGLNGPE